MLVWYVFTPAQSRQRLQTAVLYSVCAHAAVSLPVQHVYSQTVSQLIETVLNAADLRLHFAVKECATVAIALGK